MKLNGARIIIETLIEQGCDTVFGYPGGQVLNIFDELYLNSDRITHIITAHEQGASHAADGSFGMNLNELAAAVSHNIPLVIVIMNNGVLGMVRQWQTLFYNEHYSQTTLDRKTDFVKLAEAFGAAGTRVFTEAQLDEACKKAFAQNGTFIIDCAVDCDEFVLPMLPPGGSIDDMITKL